MNPGSVTDQAVEQVSQKSSGEWEVEQGYCSDWAVVGEESSHFQGSVGELARSYAEKRSCGHPWFVGRQVGEMTGLETRGKDSAVSQESMSADPASSGEERYRAEMKDRAGSFGC